MTSIIYAIVKFFREFLAYLNEWKESVTLREGFIVPKKEYNDAKH